MSNSGQLERLGTHGADEHSYEYASRWDSVRPHPRREQLLAIDLLHPRPIDWMRPAMVELVQRFGQVYPDIKAVRIGDYGGHPFAILWKEDGSYEIVSTDQEPTTDSFDVNGVIAITTLEKSAANTVTFRTVFRSEATGQPDMLLYRSDMVFFSDGSLEISPESFDFGVIDISAKAGFRPSNVTDIAGQLGVEGKRIFPSDEGEKYLAESLSRVLGYTLLGPDAVADTIGVLIDTLNNKKPNRLTPAFTQLLLQTATNRKAPRVSEELIPMLSTKLESSRMDETDEIELTDDEWQLIVAVIDMRTLAYSDWSDPYLANQWSCQLLGLSDCNHAIHYYGG